MPDEAPTSSRKSWWSNRSEKFKQTVVVALIGAIPGTLAGTAGLLKKQDEKTARDVYSVLVKLIERVSVEQDTTQRNVEALHVQVATLSKQVDALSRQVNGASSAPAASPPLLPTRRAQIRVTDQIREPGQADLVESVLALPASPLEPVLDVDSDGVIDVPAAWPE